jgi:hypothetical protein
LLNRQPEQTSPFVEENVERVKLNVPVRATMLQRVELHSAIVIDDNYFTINERIRREFLASTRNLREAHCETVSAP